jgi:hypothetical protein
METKLQYYTLGDDKPSGYANGMDGLLKMLLDAHDTRWLNLPAKLDEEREMTEREEDHASEGSSIQSSRPKVFSPE